MSMKARTDMKITAATTADYPQLLSVWESSVKATHHFLALDDFMFYRSRMYSYFNNVTIHACMTDTGRIAGFIGTAGDSVEMLFVDAAYRGMGIGRQLITYAIDTLHMRRLDVNEQNTQAVDFYRHMGFRVAGRSPLDGEGKPYPVLHLEV